MSDKCMKAGCESEPVSVCGCGACVAGVRALSCEEHEAENSIAHRAKTKQSALWYSVRSPQPGQAGDHVSTARARGEVIHLLPFEQLPDQSLRGACGCIIAHGFPAYFDNQRPTCSGALGGAAHVGVIVELGPRIEGFKLLPMPGPAPGRDYVHAPARGGPYAGCAELGAVDQAARAYLVTQPGQDCAAWSELAKATRSPHRAILAALDSGAPLHPARGDRAAFAHRAKRANNDAARAAASARDVGARNFIELAPDEDTYGRVDAAAEQRGRAAELVSQAADLARAGEEIEALIAAGDAEAMGEWFELHRDRRVRMSDAAKLLLAYKRIEW